MYEYEPPTQPQAQAPNGQIWFPVAIAISVVRWGMILTSKVDRHLISNSSV